MTNTLFAACATCLILGLLMAMGSNKATAYGFTALGVTFALVGVAAEFR